MDTSAQAHIEDARAQASIGISRSTHAPAYDTITDLHVNISVGASYPEVTAPNLISAFILILTSLFGLIMNSLYIWVLRFRMVQSVNTTWFLHLIITNLIFTLDMPIIAAYVLRNPNWTLGSFMCKMNNALVEMCAHAAVFFLMAISIDRFLSVFYPVWHRKHVTPYHAYMVCLALWGLAVLCSSPYFILCNVEQDQNITLCCAEFTISRDEGQLEKLKLSTQWVLYFFHLSMSFLLPFSVMVLCYFRIAFKLKLEQKPKSNKPYKLISIVIASFFICWMPYHIRNGMILEKGRFREQILQTLLMLTTCFTCINCCLTPMLYLFIVDSFSKEFKKSTQSCICLVK
ncbi:putative G-protein coupled receptor 33 [Lithobates pipiens]